MIADNVRKVRSRIEAAARRSNRPAGGIELLASTKGRSVEEIGEALAAGVRLIGENRVQEAARKFPELRGRASMQMIGHLQRNKVAEALRIFDLIHSLTGSGSRRRSNGRRRSRGAWCRCSSRSMSRARNTSSGCAPTSSPNSSPP